VVQERERSSDEAAVQSDVVVRLRHFYILVITSFPSHSSKLSDVAIFTLTWLNLLPLGIIEIM